MRTMAWLAAPLLVAAATATAQQARVDELPGWLAGAWEMRDGARWSDEFWTPPRAGLMIGAGRSGRGDRLESWESMRIQRGADGRLSFLAQPRGAPAVEFPMVESGPRSITFANPAHDYPQRIRYWRDGPELEAEVALMDGARAVRWTFAPMGR